MTYQLRDLVTFTATRATHRVVWIDAGSTWLINLDQHGAWPEKWSTEELEEEPIQELEPNRKDIATRIRTPKGSDHAKETYERFKSVLDNIPALLTTNGRSQALKLLLDKDDGLSKTTFYKVVRLWFRGGCITPALDGAWQGPRQAIDRGAIKSMSYQHAVKIVQEQALAIMRTPFQPPLTEDFTRHGKPRERSVIRARSRYKVDAATLRVFEKFFKIKLSKRGKTLKSVYKQMNTEVFSTESPTGDTTSWPEYAIPSEQVFSNWFYELIAFKSRRVALTGSHDFDLNGRATLGQNVSAAYTAGAIGSLDATIWNVDLVGDGPDAPLIGPAIVFRIRCKDTGMLLGISVGLESASWMGAASAIANALEDKVEFCRRYDVPITHDQWPTRGLPATIEADCGETHNEKPQRFLLATDISLKNLQKGRGDLKGGVESDFNTIQTPLNGLAISAVIKKYKETHHRTFRSKATLTLDGFTRILILAELDRMIKPRPMLKLPLAMIRAGVDSAPLSMCTWLVANKGGGFRMFPERETRLSLLDSKKGSITADGLAFQGLLYLAPSLIDADAFATARRQGAVPVHVAFDPRLVDVVYIMEGPLECPSAYVECRLNMHRLDQRDFAGKTFREVRMFMTTGKRTNVNAASRNRDITAHRTRMQEEEVHKSNDRVAMARLTYPASTNALIASKPANRLKAKNEASPTQAIVPAPPKVSPPSSVPIRSNVVSIVDKAIKKPDEFAARAAAAFPEEFE